MTNQQFYIIAGAGLLVAFVAKDKIAAALDTVNPANNDNIFRQGVERFDELTGQTDERIQMEDTIFGAMDLLNPNAPAYRKDYARRIFGWGE